MTDSHSDSSPTAGLRGLSRRHFLTATAGSLGAVLAWRFFDGAPARAGVPVSGPAAAPVPFDTGWLFGPWTTGGSDPKFDDSGLVTVTVPHTVAPLSWRNWDPATWDQVWLYRKHFDAPAGSDGMRVFVDFDGAMTGSTLTLNGRELPGNVGGYLPFTAELTPLLQPVGNVLAVQLDSRFNIDVPPDRPAPYSPSSVDFWQPGGIYRDVHLRVVPQVFLADVFAKPVNVLDTGKRRVDLQCTVDAASVPQGDITITVDLRDGAKKIASTTVPVALNGTGQTEVAATLSGLAGITLWDLDNPHLYDVVATLSVNDTAIHDYRVRIGFREARFELDGFFLNGRRVKLLGVNRHQIYPFTGHAMPARVQRRDADILRNELNCTMVRCSHYPQSEAFYDACDELGLLAWEEIPGWGYFGDSAWQAAEQRNLREMIVRDRNHPSIIVWGAMPNESRDHPTQYTAWNQLAHSLDDSRPTGGDDLGFGGSLAAGYQFDVYSHHDYSHHTGADGLRVPDLRPPTDAANKPYLVTEAVGTLSGPATFYRRTDAQWVQQGQATAHARVQDIAASDDRYCGCLAWSGYDYPSGSGNQFQGIKYTGVVDVFRNPKPGAAIYHAQVDPHVRPVIAPAFYWDFGTASPINELGQAMICANVDRLEIYVGGSHFATATPDTANYGHLPYPPSFVDFSTVDGSNHPELRIDGYLGSSKVATRSFSSDPSADRLALALDDTELIGDGSDATRVSFRAVDKYGQPRPYVPGDVTLKISGPAALVGETPFPFADTGSAGAVWLRTIRDTPGTVTITAQHPTLGSGSATARITVPAPAGVPAPYGTLQATAASVLTIPSAPTAIGASFTNNGLPNLDTVELSLQLPAGWSSRATTSTSFSGVKSGNRVSAGWQVTVPAGTAPGSYQITIAAEYSAHGEVGRTNAILTAVVPYASLAAAYDNTGISDDSNVDSADFDGVGDSYSAEALAAAGLTPGSVVSYSGVSLAWPDVSPGAPDNVLAQGQTIQLSGAGQRLAFLGASSPSDIGGQGTVFYADGSTSTFNLVLDNWWYGADTSDDTAVASLQYLNSQGIGWRPRGQRAHTVYVFATSVDITPGKQVAAITLPSGGSIASGRISGMHVFAAAVGA